MRAASNLVSVSGPIWNAITGHLLEASPIPVSFKAENGTDVLVDEAGSLEKVYRATGEAGIVRECHAIVYRGSRETSADRRKKHFVVAAGISALGTYGAVTWLRKCSTQRLRDNYFVRRLKKHEHALVILRVRDRSPKGFQAYSAGPDSPGFLSIDVIAEYSVTTGRPSASKVAAA